MAVDLVTCVDGRQLERSLKYVADMHVSCDIVRGVYFVLRKTACYRNWYAFGRHTVVVGV